MVKSDSAKQCFLSHSTDEKPTAELIGIELLRAGIEPWIDHWDMYAGDNLQTEIESALSNCDAFLVLLSKNSTKSQWVNLEISTALSRKRHNASFRIIPIVVEDCEVPAALSQFVYIDFRKGKSIGIQALLRALKGANHKPTVDSYIPTLGIKKAVQRIEISGNARDCILTEHFSVMPTRKVEVINRNLFYSGTLTSISSDLFKVQRYSIAPSHEKLELLPIFPIAGNDEFEYSVEYRIDGCFSLSTEFWLYSIESPTDYVKIIFDFSKTDCPDQLLVHHKQGQSLYPDPSPMIQDGHIFIWEKLFPQYKDSYEFKMIWKVEQ